MRDISWWLNVLDLMRVISFMVEVDVAIGLRPHVDKLGSMEEIKHRLVVPPLSHLFTLSYNSCSREEVCNIGQVTLST